MSPRHDRCRCVNCWTPERGRDGARSAGSGPSGRAAWTGRRQLSANHDLAPHRRCDNRGRPGWQRRSRVAGGAVLELMAMETLPVGASRYPEWGSAAVVAGTLAAVRDVPRSGALVVAVFAGIATAWAGGWSMYGLRRLNGGWAERMQPAVEAGSWRAVVGLQLRGLTADLVRAALLTLVALLVWRPIDRWLLSRWSLDLVVSHSILVAVAAAAAASAIWRLGHGATGARWYLLGGLAAGMALVVLQ